MFIQTLYSIEKFNRYDSIDEDVLRCYSEFSFAAHIYYALKEGLVSELSARMTAMDGASKNAGNNIFADFHPGLPIILQVQK